MLTKQLRIPAIESITGLSNMAMGDLPALKAVAA
jgi:hypothetical protein